MVEIEGVPERILRKIEPNSGTGCWLWTAFRDKYGYGRGTIDGKAVLVHRVTFEAVNGPVPRDLVVDHICNNPGCVNPAHLRAISYRANQVRSPKFKGRQYPHNLGTLITERQYQGIKQFCNETGRKRGEMVRALLEYALDNMPRDNA